MVDEVNGKKVIGRLHTADKRGGKPVEVILVEGDREFVTARYVDGDGTWDSGHYFCWGRTSGVTREEELRRAQADLLKRAQGF